MIRVQFFARYREMLGPPRNSLAWASCGTVGDLREHTWSSAAAAGPRPWWRGTDVRAQRRTLWPGRAALRDGDEVAFFPTVTGG